MICRFVVFSSFLSILMMGCTRQNLQYTNVLLIIVDTLRADQLGCYGNQKELTPNIDNLASQGVKFLNAEVRWK